LTDNHAGGSDRRPHPVRVEHQCKNPRPPIVSAYLLTPRKVHVFHVSPALTVIEKTTTKAFANLFNFDGPFAGGISCPGGSGSNLTSLIVARNTLYPETKTKGNGKHDFVVFTSAHGHYSVEKAAMITGLGSSAVWAVPVDSEGSMRPQALRELILLAKKQGKTPFYVNSTAGTTVMGSFDPFEEISKICKEFGLWLHIDASWGGSVIFSKAQNWKMKGSHLADSLTVNPHKMLNAPCAFSSAQTALLPDTSSTGAKMKKSGIWLICLCNAVAVETL
jgi:glutamate decarboxylase